MKTLSAWTAAAAVVAAPVLAQDVKEPRTGVSFAAKEGSMSLMGVGLRVKQIAFIKAKVYAIGLYVADEALAGSLAALKGKGATPELYKELQAGDYPKQVTLKFVRGLGKGRIQEAMREALPNSDKAPVDTFVSYFDEVKEGDTCTIAWAPGGALDIAFNGKAKPPIADKKFAGEVFGIWLGAKPIQEDIKKELVSRF